MSASSTPDYELLWLDYRLLPAGALRAAWADAFKAVTFRVAGGSDLVLTSAWDELRRGAVALTGEALIVSGSPVQSRTALAGGDMLEARDLGEEGFALKRAFGGELVILAGGSRGALYGVFALLRHAQLGGLPDDTLLRCERPAMPLRMLNHWDNPVRSEVFGDIERGYSGGTIFNWNTLETPAPRLRDYARLVASLGINHVCINNVNADPVLLKPERLAGLAALATLLRAWGVRMWISINWASPMLLDGLPTADPDEADVQAWWRSRIQAIYAAIPDFGGFLVKANSEGQPGPHDYGHTHADGANFLGRLLAPHGGQVLWRAFVYGRTGGKSGGAFEHFSELDGQFDANVMVQIKHGPSDFQPNEPLSPLLFAMPRTRVLMELMITQEYTGQDVHLYYYGTQWREILDFPFQRDGRVYTLADLLSGNLPVGQPATGMGAVSNFGQDANWCGHPLAAANAYAYARLCWNPRLGADVLAREWARLTWGDAPEVITTVTALLMESRDAYVRYTGGYGLWMTFGFDHFNPDPEIRAHFHCAGPDGIGFDRTRRSSANMTAQYPAPWAECLEDVRACPEKWLLFFHHVPLSFRLKDGRTIKDALLADLDKGVADVDSMAARWQALEAKLPAAAWRLGVTRFARQCQEARRWRDSLRNCFLQRMKTAVPALNAHAHGTSIAVPA